MRKRSTARNLCFYALSITFTFINLSSCAFHDNAAYGHIVALNVIRSENDQYSDVQIHLSVCNFNGNTGGNSILNIQSPTGGDLYSKVNLSNLTFSNNNGTAMHCVFTHLTFQDNILFV